MRKELERIEIPGEHEARERAWAVFRSAFEERTPTARPRLRLRPVIAVAVAVALLAAAFSSPGTAVLDRIRKSVGVEKAAPSLFSLPARGKLLVRSDSGIWVVQQDGSKRLLRGYREASWSPFGRFLVAARKDELAALEPGGNVHWTLARPGARVPTWGGTRTDTRIAYLSGTNLRVVAGDGTGDRAACSRTSAKPASAAWRPGSTSVIALAARGGSVAVVALDGCRVLWRTGRGRPPTKLEWSSDGRRLLVLSRPGLRVYDGRGRLVDVDDPSDASRDLDATFLPGTHTVVGIRLHGSQSDVFGLRSGRSLFHVAGGLEQLAASPDGRWLLVTWPGAGQWIFVRVDGRGIRAVSNITSQFDSAGFPRIEGWAP